VVGGFGDLGRLVVADFGGEGSDQHEGVADVVSDLFDWLRSPDAVDYEAVAGIGEELDGVEIIENHHGLKTFSSNCLGNGEADGGIIAMTCTETMVRASACVGFNFAA